VAAPAKRGQGKTHRKGSRAEAAPKSRDSKNGAGKARTGRGGKPSRRDLGRQVSQELLKLRPLFKDVGSALLHRLDGELAGLAHTLNGGGISGEAPVLPQTPILVTMLDDIRALKLKPKKGRVKDLRRIETLLESLAARIPPEA
jgi:hypothetical protein